MLEVRVVEDVVVGGGQQVATAHHYFNATASAAAVATNQQPKCAADLDQPEQLYVKLSTFWYCFLALITTIGLLVSLISNMIIIYLFTRTPSLRKNPSNIIAVNLSLSDLLYCTQWPSVIYCSLTQSTWILEYEIVCQTFGFITVSTALASILTVLAMSVERAIVIIYSIQAKNRFSIRSAWLIIVLIWLVCLASCLPPLFGRFNRYTLDPSKTSCTLDYLSRQANYKLYILVLYVAYWIVPFIIISISYILIIVTFKRSSLSLKKVSKERDSLPPLPGSPNIDGTTQCDSSAAPSPRQLNHDDNDDDKNNTTRSRFNFAARRRRHRAVSKARDSIRLRTLMDSSPNKQQKEQQHKGQRSKKLTPPTTDTASTTTTITTPSTTTSGSGNGGPTASSSSEPHDHTSQLPQSPPPPSAGHLQRSEEGSGSSHLSSRRSSTGLLEMRTIRRPSRQLLPAGGDGGGAGDDGDKRIFFKRVASTSVLRGQLSASQGRKPPNLKQVAQLNATKLNRSCIPLQAIGAGRRIFGDGELFGRSFGTSEDAADDQFPLPPPGAAISRSTLDGLHSSLSNILSKNIRLCRYGPNRVSNTASTISQAARSQLNRTVLQFRLAKMSFYLILLWLVSWTPIASLAMVNSVVGCHRASATAVFMASTMTKLGPAFDVFIYGISHPKIKSKFKQIIRWLFMVPDHHARRNDSQRDERTSAAKAAAAPPSSSSSPLPPATTAAAAGQRFSITNRNSFIFAERSPRPVMIPMSP